MMYDCAEKLGKSTVWQGAPFSLFFSLPLSVLLSEFRTPSKRPEVLFLCTREPENRLALLLFSCSHSLSTKPTKERKGEKHMYEKEKDNCFKKTGLE